MSELKKQMEKIMNDQWQQKVRAFKELNAYAKKGQIVFVGSSLAENFPICEMLQNLETRYIVYNRGIGGDITEGLMKRMNESIFDLKPKKIFINIGTNDISREGYKAEKLMANYKKILEDIGEKLPETKVYVMSFYPVNRELPWLDKNSVDDMFGARTNAELIKVNKMLNDMALEMGFEFIDVFNCLTDEKGNLKEEYAIDGMHMYPNGYMVVLDILKKYF